MPLDAVSAVTTRPFQDADLGVFQAWWRAHGCNGIPKECLPIDGVMVLVNGAPAAASFVYVSTEAAFAFVAWTIADADLAGCHRATAIAAAVEGVVEIARRRLGNRGFIWSSTPNAGLQRIYRRLGMVEAEHNLTSFYVPLGNLDPDFLTEDAPQPRA